ncbi:hypothetical protein CRYUN_Cryun17cG0006800 [Craigia yunnanensis]
MVASAFSASSLFGSRITEPLTLISSKSRSTFNFKRTPSIKILGEYSCLEVKDVHYRPPGTQINLLNGVSFSLPEKSFGLIIGQSGSGKTTLLQVYHTCLCVLIIFLCHYIPRMSSFFSFSFQLLAGLSKPTSGSIYIQRYTNEFKPNQSPKSLVPERVGIVFQFPERYFVADNVLDEVTFGWPRQRGGLQLKEHLALNLQKAFNWIGRRVQML